MTTYATAQAKKPSGCAIGDHEIGNIIGKCMRCGKTDKQIETRPPCDACGAESRGNQCGVPELRGAWLCDACWRRPVSENETAIRSRRAALAEKKEFKVGDRVTAQGCIFNGTIGGCGMLTGELTSLDASANGHPDLASINGMLCLRSTLRHETPPVKERHDLFCQNCGYHKTGCMCANPPSPEATKKPDPYRLHADDEVHMADEAVLAKKQANRDAERLRKMSTADRRKLQALENLTRPLPRPSTVKVGYSATSGGVERCGRTVENSHPESWPEDSGEELGHS